MFRKRTDLKNEECANVRGVVTQVKSIRLGILCISKSGSILGNTHPN